jgi:hypothetical protein
MQGEVKGAERLVRPGGTRDLRAVVVWWNRAKGKAWITHWGNPWSIFFASNRADAHTVVRATA